MWDALFFQDGNSIRDILNGFVKVEPSAPSSVSATAEHAKIITDLQRRIEACERDLQIDRKKGSSRGTHGYAI